MRIHYFATAAAAAAALAFAGVCASAEPHPAGTETHEIPIDQQVEIAQSMADHEAVAQRFDAEAAQFEKHAAEHERLAKHYRSGLGAGPKADAVSMANHCERIARNLRGSATDARAMARMHRDVSHKLLK